MTTAARLSALVPALAGHRVVVLGDAILDEYLLGRATRMSREAPVPVLEFESRRVIPGGAANPAANIARLGSAAVQIAVVGADPDGEALRAVLDSAGIDTSGLVTDARRPTTVKTRLLAHMGLRFPQQVARMDRLSREPLDADTEAAVLDRVQDALRGAGAILVSDYHIGLLSPALVARVADAAAGAGVLLAADAQGSFDKYAGFGLVKCNADEARAFLRRGLSSDDDFADAARALRAALHLTRAMVITRGAVGATYARADGEVGHCPAPVVTDVFDTVGAGDTAVAVLTLATLAGATLVDSVMLANHASGLVVRRVGNYTPSPDELLAAVSARFE